MRDRLIELIKNAPVWKNGTFDEACEFVADHLIENGVIVPPCKVGDKLYIVTAVSKEIVESVVIGLWMADGVFSVLTIHGVIIADSLGKAVFFTKEEAEKALRGEGE